MNPRTGSRVCSTIYGYYKNIPGTVEGRSQIQTFDRPGWSYDVRLDTGRRIRLSEFDMIEVTPEIEGAYNQRAERDAEMNRRAEERAQRRADSMRRTEEHRKTRREEMAREEQADREAEHEAKQTKLREEKGREYGLRSLGVYDE